MIAHSFENGVEVDCRNAHFAQVGEFFFDALERSAVEVPCGDGAVGISTIGGGCGPVLYKALGAAASGLCALGGSSLAPCGVARKTIREDLIGNAIFIPCRALTARLIHRELERGDFCIVVDNSFATLGARRGSDAHFGAVGLANDERVPDDSRCVPGERCREHAALATIHGNERFAFAIDPDAQRACCFLSLAAIDLAAQVHCRVAGDCSKWASK